MHPLLRIFPVVATLAMATPLPAQEAEPPVPAPETNGSNAAPETAPAEPTAPAPAAEPTAATTPPPIQLPKRLPRSNGNGVPRAESGSANGAAAAPRLAGPMEAEREEQITLEYPNADVLAILEVWEKLTGKKALHDSTVQGPCGIDVRKPVSKTEAIRIIESALLLNGFTLVPGPGDTIVRVLGASKSPRQFGPPLYTDLSELPENDVVVSFLFRLEHADPTEVHAVLSQYIVPTPYSTLMPLPKAQSLLVIENTNVIRSLAAIVAQMDRKPAEVVSEFITLQRADAKEVIEKLNTIFEKQPTPGAPGTQAAAAAAAPAPPAPANGANGEGAAPSGEALGTTLSEDSLIVGKIKLTADTRTNRIHVVTRPVNMPLVQRLIEEFDSDIPFGEPTTRPLRFVSAGEVLDVVMKAITDPGAKEDAGTGSSASTAKAAAPISNPTNYPGTSSAYGRTGGGSLGGEELSTREVDTVPEARTVGSTKIIADKRSNSIIVLGNREVKDKIFKILDEIDVRAPQVMLTAVIGELNLTDTKEFGVNYLLRAKGIGVTGSGGTVTGANDRTFAGIASNVGGVTNDVKNLTSASALASTLGTGGLGLNGFIGASKTLEAVVHALESTGRFRVTSRPMVFTSNNKKALIASGQEVAVPGQIQSGYGNSGIGTVNNNGLVSTSNVEYKDVFLKLEVQPLINSDNEVTLDIVQEVNSLANGAGLTTSSGIQAPTINTRRIKTTVSVANNATVVLGGLVTENRTDERSGIPVLGKLPLLGPLFSSKSKAVTRNELVVLIRPTVANTPVDAIKESERSQEKLNFPPDLDATLDPPGTREKIGGKPEMLHPPKAVLRSEN